MEHTKSELSFRNTLPIRQKTDPLTPGLGEGSLGAHILRAVKADSVSIVR